MWKETMYESVWIRPINFKIVMNKLNSDELN
jgi:hypothetical protein